MITLTAEEWTRIQMQIADLTTQLEAAQKRIAELEGQKKPPPAFVKANRPERGAHVRKQRASEHNHARRRDEPTQVVRHAIERCPECQGHLSGIHVGRRRHVIDLPPPPPVAIIEHEVQRGWCSYCHAWREATLTLAGQVVGQSRMGVRLMALVAYLRQTMRLPLRAIQQMLATLHQVRLSVGELSDLLRRTAEHGQPQMEQLLGQIRASPVAHADETGWREQGRNGYIWELATPDGLRYFHYEHSRAGAVINHLLGDEFRGTLVTDFYGGYNDTPGGKHQRCWVHLLRDLRALKDAHPGSIEVCAWAQAMTDLYTRAVALPADCPLPSRVAVMATWQQETVALASQFAQIAGHPCHALCQRLLRHQDELFRFVLEPQVPAHNNLAERGIRPLVIARKISGGSRSPVGSRTRMVLASLTQTWLAHGLDPFSQFLALLQNPFPQL